MNYLKNTNNLLVKLYLGFLQPTYGMSRLPIIIINLAVWFSTLYVLVWVIDAITQTPYTQVMQLKDKKYVAEYTTITYVNGSPIISHYNEEFKLIFDKVSCNVSEGTYNSVSVGDSVKVNYYTGISSLSYCTSVTYANTSF